MNWLRIAQSRVRALFRKRVLESQMDAELRSHVEMQVQENIENGMPPEQARTSALRQFGGVDSVKEKCRDGRGVRWIEESLQDFGYGLRLLLKHKGFTIVAGLTLALGIGATTGIFSIINGVLLKPLPYPGSERIVHVWESNPKAGFEQKPSSPPNFADWKKEVKSFEALAFFRAFAGSLSRTFILSDQSGAQLLRGRGVSSEFFRVFGVEPILGRTFLPEEDERGAPRLVVLSYSLWQSLYGGAADVMGKTIILDNFGRHSYEIIGVMPKGFDYPSVSLWLPAGIMEGRFSARFNDSAYVVGRLKPGVTIKAAESEMSVIQSRIARAHPEIKRIGTSVRISTFQEAMVGSSRPVLLIFMGAVALVLLIACANVATLMLSRALARQREIAVRLALGANRWRIIRQLLVESSVLSLVGGLLGILIGYGSIRVISSYHAGSIPRLAEVTLDLRVLAFTLGLSLLTGMLFGLAPALQASKPELTDAMKDAGGQSSGGVKKFLLFRIFTAVEVALALMLLIGAGLLVQSFHLLQKVDPGFDTSHIVTVQAEMAGASFRGDGDRRRFFRELVERVRALPGVEAACATSQIPDRGEGWKTEYFRTDRPVPNITDRDKVGVHPVTPGYFSTFNIRLLKGRDFTEMDVETAPAVMVINETFARKCFPDEDPLGKALNFGKPFEIIGIVEDTKNDGLNSQTRPEVYATYHQWSWPWGILAVRTKIDPVSIGSAITREVRALNPDQPLVAFRTMEAYLAEQLARPRFQSLVIGLFALAALFLASIGIYGVMAYSVSQRTRELGIRMSLGAQRLDVVRLVVRQGMTMALIGTAFGLAGAVGLTRVLRRMLFEISPIDMPTFAAVTICLGLIALAACWLPARRAARINPMVALRQE